MRNRRCIWSCLRAVRMWNTNQWWRRIETLSCQPCPRPNNTPYRAERTRKVCPTPSKFTLSSAQPSYLITVKQPILYHLLPCLPNPTPFVLNLPCFLPLLVHLLRLLQWRNNPEHLNQHLGQFMQVDGAEVVKVNERPEHTTCYSSFECFDMTSRVFV